MSISAQRQRSLERVDALPTELRGLVHDYGEPIVYALVKHGVTSPIAIREIVREVWTGPRQIGQRSGVKNALDWLLFNSGASINSGTLRRLLADSGLYIVSSTPTRAMLDASMSEVSGFNVRCTREEKHRRRLRAAILAYDARPDSQP